MTLLKLLIDATAEGKFVTVVIEDKGVMVGTSPAFKNVKEAMDFAEFAIRDMLHLSGDYPVTFTYDKKRTVDDDIVFSINV